MKILVIEDSPTQSALIKMAVEFFIYADVQIVETETNFMDLTINGFVDGKCPWQLIISDVLFFWKNPPSKGGPDPRNAGPRCWRMFRSAGFRNVPWIYFTVLDKKVMNFSGNSDEFTYYVQKIDSTIDPLLCVIKDVLFPALQN